MAKLYNLAKMTTSTTGTGTITLGSAVTSYLTFADAGVQNGDVVTYAIADGNNREIGRGTYTASGTTLSRDTVLESTNSGSAINLSGSAEVFITAAAEDIVFLDTSGNASIAGTVTSTGVIIDNGSADGGNLILKSSGSDDYIIDNNSGSLRFYNGATVRATIDSVGTFEFKNAIKETIYSLTGTALDPSNGTIQAKTLSADVTLTDSLADGESITLMVDDGSDYEITWPTMTWVNNGGLAPTLATTGYTVIALWKVSSTLYGALVGDGT